MCDAMLTWKGFRGSILSHMVLQKPEKWNLKEAEFILLYWQSLRTYYCYCNFTLIFIELIVNDIILSI